MFRLPTQIPIEEYPGPDVFIAEAERLVGEAERSGITLRVMGGMAVYMRCPEEFKSVWKTLKRLGDRVFTDIDFVSYGVYRNSMIEFMKTVGYQTDANLIVQAGKSRHIFYGGKVPMVEVFYDRLDMNHIIDYSGRLEADKVTVPLAELMLQKLQIVKINDKDIKDLVVLLATYDVGPGDPERIDIDFLNSRYFQSDWNFYHTATTNLAKLRETLGALEALSDGDRITAIEKAINDAPKSTKWKLRAKVGPKVKWYNDVDEW